MYPVFMPEINNAYKNNKTKTVKVNTEVFSIIQPILKASSTCKKIIKKK